ncbi:putative ATP-dependent RNA helicase DDX56 [Operophtera brumata]|uniref:RNA helicase n=1 Tax=Operophtera brumata TaxID=104452 RepID=A0A0L7L7I6_OPEBR|nr:putative ATP-dependent RNA helicase DDX56 [Operophtera brumata]
MQRLLDLLPLWLDKWRMAVNVGKTAALFVSSRRRPPQPLLLRGQCIEWKPHVRYLGVEIDRYNANMGEEKKVMFHEMELDDRILKAISQLAWPEPTLIQETAIPLLLEGKDLLMRARTGSGKTAAFTIPVIQKILNLKNTTSHQSIRALILSPSKELCGQIASVIGDLTIKCAREVRCIDISSSGDTHIQKSLLSDKPDIVVATPSRALAHLKESNMRLKEDLAVMVVDEADLIFSFGYEDEIKELLGHMPKIYQAVLASATLSDDVLSLKKIALRNPVTLKLEEPELAPSSQLQHYHLFAEEDDKAAILYALLKLNLIRGKTIIFVRTVDRLKLYLEQFKIGSCVLNSELPAAVRCLSVDQFNRGRYQIIVASDEKALEKPDVLTFVSIREKPLMDAIETHLSKGFGGQKGYFEENPSDLAALRRDRALHTVRVQQHLAHVPDYLLPAALRSEDTVEEEQDTAAPVPAKKRKQTFGSSPERPFEELRREEEGSVCRRHMIAL